MGARVIPASISLFVHAPRTRKSKNGLRAKHGFVPESAWITCCKEEFGLAAPGSAPQETPCPPDKVAAIKRAFRHFGLF